MAGSVSLNISFSTCRHYQHHCFVTAKLTSATKRIMLDNIYSLLHCTAGGNTRMHTHKHANTHTHIHHYNGHFHSKPRLLPSCAFSICSYAVYPLKTGQNFWYHKMPSGPPHLSPPPCSITANVIQCLTDSQTYEQ